MGNFYHNYTYQVELIAIKRTIKLNSNHSDAYIYSDSLSSTLAIVHAYPDNEIIPQIFNYIDELNNKKMFLYWIKTDAFAKSEIEENVFNEEVSLIYPRSLLKQFSKKNLLKD